jgi:hypothetical protein
VLHWPLAGLLLLIYSRNFLISKGSTDVKFVTRPLNVGCV